MKLNKRTREARFVREMNWKKKYRLWALIWSVQCAWLCAPHRSTAAWLNTQSVQSVGRTWSSVSSAGNLTTTAWFATGVIRFFTFQSWAVNPYSEGMPKGTMKSLRRNAVRSHFSWKSKEISWWPCALSTKHKFKGILISHFHAYWQMQIFFIQIRKRSGTSKLL